MEADWEFEIATDAPVIDAAWSGFIDLRREPERAFLLPEAGKLPALANALIRMNEEGSGFWTAKCDVWEPATIDPDEFDATSDQAAHAVACYVDLLPEEEQTWSTPDSVAGWCRGLCDSLRLRPLRQCRADLVIRRAFAAPDATVLGVTAYLAGCGPTGAGATTTLEAAVDAFVDTLCAELRDKSRQKLQ